MKRSGAHDLVGYDVDTGGERIRVLLTVDARHVNRRGNLHGGISAMLLDAACGQQGRRDLGPDHPDGMATVSLNVAYIAAANLGDRLIATARQTGGGNRLRHMAAALHREDGTLLASATGVFRVICGAPRYSTDPRPPISTARVSLAFTVALPLPLISIRASLLSRSSP